MCYATCKEEGKWEASQVPKPYWMICILLENFFSVSDQLVLKFLACKHNFSSWKVTLYFSATSVPFNILLENRYQIRVVQSIFIMLNLCRVIFHLPFSFPSFSNTIPLIFALGPCSPLNYQVYFSGHKSYVYGRGQWTTWQFLWGLNTHIHTLLFTFCYGPSLFPLHSSILAKRKAPGASSACRLRTLYFNRICDNCLLMESVVSNKQWTSSGLQIPSTVLMKEGTYINKVWVNLRLIFVL